MNNLNRLTSSIIVVSLFFTQIALANGTELAVKIQACNKIHANEARLACFDELTDKKNNEKKSPSVAVLPTAALPAVTELTDKQVDSFSKEHIKKSEEELESEINIITLIVSKVTKTVYEKLNITFENGQQWRQKDSKRLRLAAGDKVILSKGALGSVYLKKEGTNKTINVKRLK